jgi:hypothetical protein
MKTMIGDRYIVIFLLRCYALGILIFPLYYQFAVTENVLYFIACLVCLGLMPLTFLQFNSVYLRSSLTKKDREELK